MNTIMKYKIKVHTIYEQGQRANQEDCIYPAKGKEADTDRLFILCDGMGGHDAGEVASATVCQAMSKLILSDSRSADGAFSDEILQAAIGNAFDALDSIDSSETPQQKKMGTTMTFLKLHDRGCTIAHIGDSRVYHIRPGRDKEDTQILFVTEDHSLVNDLVKIGELTEEEARHAKQKNVITRAMQPNMERRPKADIYHSSDIQAGDYFYLCSDGMLEQEEYDNRYIRNNFSEATGNDEEKVRILTMATSQNVDNHSAIIVHILDVMKEEKENVIEDKDEVLPAKQPTPIVIQTEETATKEERALQHPQTYLIRIKNIVYKHRGRMFFLLLLILLLFGYSTNRFAARYHGLRHIREVFHNNRDSILEGKDSKDSIRPESVKPQSQDEMKEHKTDEGF